MPVSSSLTIFLITIISCLVLHRVEPKIVSGNMALRVQWDFLARFCFQAGTETDFSSSERRFQYRISFTEANCCPSLNFYYDSPAQWKRIYNAEDMSCKERERNGFTIPLTMLDGKCRNVGDLFVCDGVRFLEGVRSRWWYLAVSACGVQTSAIKFNYTLTFTNGDHFLDKHYSADELGIMESTFVSLVITSSMFIVTMVYTRLLQKRRLNHETFKTFQASVLFYFFNCLFGVIYYCSYGYNGIVSRGYLVTARIFEAIATSLFLGLLLSFSTGYTIVCAAMSVCTFAVIMCFTGMFCLLTFCSLIWEENVFNPADVLYMYQSPPGYLTAALYIPAWIYFIANCLYTGYKFKQKRPFYFSLGMFYSVWMLCLPLLILVANVALPDWTRQKTVVISQQVVWLISYTYFLTIFRPAQSNKNFPFHLRVTKISTGAGEGTMAQDTNYNVGTKDGSVSEGVDNDMFTVVA